MKNLWSLNIDELLVASRLKEKFSKSKYEVFFPLNSQMKDIDLILVSLKSYKTVRIQVKGSRTYSPRKSETQKWGEGSAAWFTITKKSIFNLKSGVSYYIFVLHSIYNGDIKKDIRINYLIIPVKEFRTFCQKKTIRKGEKYHFFIWIDPNGNRAFDFNNRKGKEIDLSKYIDNWDLLLK